MQQNHSRKRQFPFEDGLDSSRMVRFKTAPGASHNSAPLQSVALSRADHQALQRAAYLVNRPVADLLREVSTTTTPVGSRPPRPPPLLDPADADEDDVHGLARVFDLSQGVDGDEAPNGDGSAVQEWSTHAAEFIDPNPSPHLDALGEFAFIDEFPSLGHTVPYNGFGSMAPVGRSGPGLIPHGHHIGLHHQGAIHLIGTPATVQSLVSPGVQSNLVSDTTLVDQDGPGESAADEENSSEGSAATDSQLANPSESPNRSSLDSTGSDWVEVPRNGSGPSESAHRPKAPGRGSIRWVACDPIQPSPQPRQQQRRGPFQDQRLREETGMTRKLKACVRCRMQKLRCKTNSSDPSGVCQTCKAVSHQKIYTLPCVRHKITECTLFRRGKGPGLEFTFRWPTMSLKDIVEWASDEVRTIQVESDVCPVPLQLSVRKFRPVPKDSLHRGWMDGRVKKFKVTTPWAIVSMTSAMQDMREYVTANVFKCMDFFLLNSDELVRKTYEFARKHMYRTPSEEERLLLGNFFRLWFAVRRTATIEHIVGSETLDMEPEMADKSFPLFGKIPLPPVLIQQLDMILTLGILDPLQKQVLEDFQKLILANKPRSWMTIYLITFMSLHSCACVSAENYRNARKHGLRRRYSMPNFISERHHGANVFLSHYHYCTQPCNPFNLDWKRRHTTPFADFSTDEIHFLKRTNEMVREREKRMKDDLEEELYEDELYFIAQMYEEDWSPRDTVIDYDDGTVGNVPLKKVYEG